MASNDYEFITRWRVRATIEEVADALGDAEGLARWWSSVYLRVEVENPGSANGVGRRVSLLTKGWLPYRLRWWFEVTESNAPHGFAIAAHGDFEGTGVWRFRQDGEDAEIEFIWTIRAEKPLLRRLSFVMKPIFEWNHRWAMAQGEAALPGEIARRRSHATREELVARS